MYIYINIHLVRFFIISALSFFLFLSIIVIRMVFFKYGIILNKRRKRGKRYERKIYKIYIILSF